MLKPHTPRRSCALALVTTDLQKEFFVKTHTNAPLDFLRHQIAAHLVRQYMFNSTSHSYDHRGGLSIDYVSAWTRFRSKPKNGACASTELLELWSVSRGCGVMLTTSKTIIARQVSTTMVYSTTTDLERYVVIMSMIIDQLQYLGSP